MNTRVHVMNVSKTEFLAGFPDRAVAIEAHTDSVGDDVYSATDRRQNRRVEIIVSNPPRAVK